MTGKPETRAGWEDVRCRHCKRLVCKITAKALRSGAMVEAKCPSCNTFNYLVGVEESEAHEGD